MATLLLRCIAPMQSWGINSAFELRGTEAEPSKSGIIGLVCAALGRDRSEAIDDLAALKMGVRIDSAGHLEHDFQTVQGVAKASSGVDNQLSKRYYLADAAFLVGLEGDVDLLMKIETALKNPTWPLFLGRKSYLPSYPVAFSESELPVNPLQQPLLSALQILRSINPHVPRSQVSSDLLRVVVECSPNDMGATQRSDQPVSFAYGERRFAKRYVKCEFVKNSDKEL